MIGAFSIYRGDSKGRENTKIGDLKALVRAYNLSNLLLQCLLHLHYDKK